MPRFLSVIEIQKYNSRCLDALILKLRFCHENIFLVSMNGHISYFSNTAVRFCPVTMLYIAFSTLHSLHYYFLHCNSPHCNALQGNSRLPVIACCVNGGFLVVHFTRYLQGTRIFNDNLMDPKQKRLYS